MDYTPSSSTSYRGLVPKWESPTASHPPQMDWLSSNSATKIEIVDDEDDQNKSSSSIEREHMFDKVVTPSDVGKLNRLVIPKQHAEKYFPLDSTNNEKGLLLNFEDRTGKPWRFRYSYWNSSQSYVMTKGWSRFVKEKKLDAGDIVSFQRGVGEVGKDKLFIDWRRRPDGSGILVHGQSVSQYHQQHRTMPAAWATSSPTFVLRSHPHPHPHPHPHHPYHNYNHQPYSYPPQSGGGPVWDHQGSGTHLSSMSLMNVLPSQSHHPLRRGAGMGVNTGMGTCTSTSISHGGSGSGHFAYGYGNVVNPYPVTGSLIFLRSSSAVSSSTSATTSTMLALPQNVSSSDDDQVVAGTVMQMHREGGSGVEPMVYESVPVVQGKAAAKRLRLFGVNMDCPISHQTHDFDILSSSLASSSSSSSTPNNQPHHHHHYHEQQLLQQQEQQTPAISMGPPSSTSSFSPLQLSSLYNSSTSDIPLDKGKSSTSSSMSLDLDI